MPTISYGRATGWETAYQLPTALELLPLHQALIPPALAFAFGITSPHEHSQGTCSVPLSNSKDFSAAPQPKPVWQKTVFEHMAAQAPSSTTNVGPATTIASNKREREESVKDLMHGRTSSDVTQLSAPSSHISSQQMLPAPLVPGMAPGQGLFPSFPGPAAFPGPYSGYPLNHPLLPYYGSGPAVSGMTGKL